MVFLFTPTQKESSPTSLDIAVSEWIFPSREMSYKAEADGFIGIPCDSSKKRSIMIEYEESIPFGCLSFLLLRSSPYLHPSTRLFIGSLGFSQKIELIEHI
jgi:hypothetical protein